MIAFGSVGIKCDHQIPQTFTIGKLSEHQRKQLVPASEMLHIFVALIGTNNIIELIPIQKVTSCEKTNLSLCIANLCRVANVGIEIRLIEKHL